MAQTVVFVDDAVTGVLPPVCVRTGQAADGIGTIRDGRGAPTVAWILVFFGPIGWLALLVVVLCTDRSELIVRLPYRTEAWRRMRTWSRLGMVGLIGGVLIVVVGVVVAQTPATAWALTAIGLTTGAVGAVVGIAAHFALPRITLDRSRRWVTLGRVHPAFAAAVAARARVDSPARV